jgi:translocation and assembly module TamB
MTRLRRFLVFFLILLVVAGTLWWLARLYLSSQHIRAQVASRLQSAYGAPVQLRGADIGIRGSSLRKVQLFESEDSAGEEPWLVIENAEADIPLWDLIKSGALPSRLTLSGVAITLRFDKAGHLLTHIPTSASTVDKLPDINIDGGQIIIRQEGHPEFVVTGVHTDVQDLNQRLAVTGGVTDSTWGHWTINGSFDRKTTAGSAALKTADVHFTPATLARLPFVPDKIWQQVKADGDTAIDCSIRNDPATKRIHYHIALEPRDSAVELAPIELHADHGRGKITVEDGIITVQNLQGRAADGDIKATGKLDFERTPPQMDFKVDADKLELDKLPKSWQLPPFGGRLSGHADLQVTLADGKIRTNGSGQGKITGVRIPGAPESKPILLKLYPSGEGFRFSSTNPDSESRLNTPLTPPVILTVALLVPQEPEPQRGIEFAPEEIANLVGKGIIRGVDALVRAGTELSGQLPKRRTSAAKPQETPSYLEARLGLDNVDVAQLVQGLKIPLPFPIAGKISFNVRFAVPLNAPRDLKSYRLQGTVNSRRLSVAGQELEALRARVVYSDGVLRLEELTGQIPAEPDAGSKAGLFNGTARLEVIPSGELTAQLTLDAIPLARALALMPKTAEQAHGVFSGTVDARVPAARLRDTAAWKASGTVSSQRLELYGLALEDATVALRIDQGLGSIQIARGRLEGAPVTGAAELRLVKPHAFTGRINLQKADLAAIQHLSPGVKPPVSISGQLDAAADVKGMLDPFNFQTTGNGTVISLAVDQLTVGTLRLRWEGDRESIKMTDLQASLYGGELSGSAVLPIQPSAAGNVDVRIQNLDVGALSKDVPALPIQLEGRATGRLEGTLSAVETGRPREFTSKLELQAPQLRVQGIPTEHLHGSLDYRNQALTYQFEGETLGGRFHLNGQIPAEKPEPAGPRPPEGHFHVEGAQLGRLARVFGFPTTVRAPQGAIDLEVAFRHEGPNREPIGGGRFSLDRLRWGTSSAAGSIRGEVALMEHEIRLRNLTGELAQGSLRGYLAVNLRQANRSSFSLTLDQADASRLLAPWPALADRVDGPLQVRLRGRLGRQWYGGGEITVVRGRVSGVEVVDWHQPFDWAFAPSRGSGQLDIRESTGHLALGRVVSRASLAWGNGLQVEGHVRFFGVELRPLLRQMTELSQIGAGKISGQFDFAGREVRSLDDLTGTFDAKLEQTQALQLPVLQQLTPFLMGGGSSTAVFQSGSLRGRLAGGVVRIEQLTFARSVMQLFINGTITLQGRLNLDVTANTGTVGANPTFLNFLGLRVPTTGPIPVALLLEASTYFSNRLVHMRVTGTVRSPIITVGPISFLTEEAVRFFLNRLPVP